MRWIYYAIVSCQTSQLIFEEIFDYKFVANVNNKQHMSVNQLYDTYKQDDSNLTVLVSLHSWPNWKIE